MATNKEMFAEEHISALETHDQVKVVKEEASLIEKNETAELNQITNSDAQSQTKKDLHS